MLALLYDPEAPHGLRLGEAPDPEPSPSEVLIDVRAVSVNFGEVAFMDRRAPGEIVGWDAAGIVLSGPDEGKRVVSFARGGGWAQRRVAAPADIAVLPDDVSFEEAAALPAAGVTALRAVRRLGAVVGRRVLVTGASGGVGGFAVQLLERAGAEVVAASRRSGVRDVRGIDPVDFVLDNVGGAMLDDALSRLGAGGLALSIGSASLEPTTLDFEALRLQGGVTVEAFHVGVAFGRDLETLLRLRLDPRIGWRGPWDGVYAALDARVAGKTILEVGR